MRPDVKLGIIISLVFVFAAGTYFLYRDRQEAPIPVLSSPDDLSRSIVTDEPLPSILEPGPWNEPPAAHGVADLNTTQDSGKDEGRVAVRRSTPAQTHPATPIKHSEPPAQQDRTADRQRAGVGSAAKGERRRSAEGGSTDRRTTKQRPAGPSKNTDLPAGGAAVDRHYVQEGDTFSSLAERYYGSAKFVPFLITSNPQIADPNHLRIGEIIKIPPQPADGANQSPTLGKGGGPMRTYHVKPGDSFYQIARDVLGDASRWRELFELNKELVDGDPTRLRVGQTVTLPKP